MAPHPFRVFFVPFNFPLAHWSCTDWVANIEGKRKRVIMGIRMDSLHIRFHREHAEEEAAEAVVVIVAVEMMVQVAPVVAGRLVHRRRLRLPLTTNDTEVLLLLVMMRGEPEDAVEEGEEIKRKEMKRKMEKERREQEANATHAKKSGNM